MQHFQNSDVTGVVEDGRSYCSFICELFMVEAPASSSPQLSPSRTRAARVRSDKIRIFRSDIKYWGSSPSSQPATQPAVSCWPLCFIINWRWTHSTTGDVLYFASAQYLLQDTATLLFDPAAQLSAAQQTRRIHLNTQSNGPCQLVRPRSPRPRPAYCVFKKP